MADPFRSTSSLQNALSADTSLSQAKLLELWYRHKAGDEKARERIILSCIKLVSLKAHRYSKTSLPINDAFAAGVEGLMQALAKWDPSKGAPFHTYAGYWISQRISRAHKKNYNLIKFPTSVWNKHREIRAASIKHSEPDLLDNPFLAQRLGFSCEDIDVVRRCLEGTLSLDDECGFCLSKHNFAPDPSSSVADLIDTNESIEQLRWRIPRLLTERQASILRMRFGINRKKAMTLGEVAAELSLTLERIRQIEEGAIKALHPNGPSKQRFGLPRMMEDGRHIAGTDAVDARLELLRSKNGRIEGNSRKTKAYITAEIHIEFYEPEEPTLSAHIRDHFTEGESLRLAS